MLHRKSLNCFAARTHCWLIFSLSTRTPRAFPAELLPSWSVPSPYCSREGFHPRYGTWHLVLLNFMIFLAAVLSFIEVPINDNFVLQYHQPVPPAWYRPWLAENALHHTAQVLNEDHLLQLLGKTSGSMTTLWNLYLRYFWKILIVKFLRSSIDGQLRILIEPVF